MNKFSAHRITRASSFKNYILGAFIRHKAGTRKNILIVVLGLAMLFPRRWPVLHKLLSIHLALVHLSTGKGPTGTFNTNGELDDLNPRTRVHQPPHQTEVAPRHGFSRPQPNWRPFMVCSAMLWSSTSCFSWSLKGTGCLASAY